VLPCTEYYLFGLMLEGEAAPYWLVTAYLDRVKLDICLSNRLDESLP
jgi:hypothetical protein